jgi:hypothetical protein
MWSRYRACDHPTILLASCLWCRAGCLLAPFPPPRAEAGRLTDALSARVTLLEGQLRFLANRLEAATAAAAAGGAGGPGAGAGGGAGSSSGREAPAGGLSSGRLAGLGAAGGGGGGGSIAGWLLQQQRAGALLGSSKSPWRGVR